MSGTSLQEHLNFFMPRSSGGGPFSLRFTPELIKIFYIARVIFSDASRHRIKTQTAPLLDRKQIFAAGLPESAVESAPPLKAPMDNFINLTRMSSLGDIAHLLPREHVIYAENIFYRKVANRELIKIDYEGSASRMTSVDRFMKREETPLQKSQKIYLLLDNSTSMNGEKFKKLYTAKAIAAEYLRRVSKERPQIYFRSFHSSIGELFKAKTLEEINVLTQHIVGLPTGGGHLTNIGDAVVQAIEDIRTDPELAHAEILVLTDGFGAVPKDLRKQLGKIKLHVILIPDLDIEKIMNLYPNRQAWECGRGEGSRPMPAFWQCYGNPPTPAILDEDEFYHKTVRSYRTAGKSVKELKVAEILQGLNQVYTLQEVCENFIFVVITSLLEDRFSFTAREIETVAAQIKQLQERLAEAAGHEEMLDILQTVHFLIQFLLVAKSNSTDSNIKKRVREFEKALHALKARILEDPWIQSLLKTEGFKLEFSMGLAPAGKKESRLSLSAAALFLVRLLWEKFLECWRQLRADYRF